MKHRAKKGLFLLLFAAVLVYFGWRMACTLPFGSTPGMIASIVLLVTELAGAAEMLIHFRVLLGDQPAEENPRARGEELPDVDVLIPTYGEPVELLKGTLIACKKMKYPPEKVHIVLCDDANRTEMRELAKREGVRYLTREEHLYAKAGNLNAALKETASPFVVVFDADMQPKSAFLSRTVPYLLKNPRLAFVQTPQHFRNADLFQPFLSGRRTAPDEQVYFYQCIEPASSSINGVILAGSNVLIRREALEEAGGFAEWTLTEDFATGMEMERRGWQSLALREILAEGLFPEKFTSLIRQRRRWARGCIRSGRKGKKKGLSLLQRLHYTVSVQYWYFPVKRLIYLCMPLLYALFGIPVLKAKLWQMAAFWLPMYLLGAVGLRVYSGGIRSVHRSVFYEYCLMPYLLLPVLAETFGPGKKEFEVTEKSGAPNRKQTSGGGMTALLLPHLALLALSVAGLVRILMRLPASGVEPPVFLLFWLAYDTAVSFQIILFLVSCRRRGTLS